MRETKPCPQCGAQMQHRDKHGDVVCAYCNTVLFMAEAQEMAPAYQTMTHTAGSLCMLSYAPRDVWRL